jgi:hypothetical protein
MLIGTLARSCNAINKGGRPCRQAPLLDDVYCFWHSPSNAQAAAEARRLGGQRIRREATVAGAYEVDGLGSVAALRRVLEVAMYDTLGQENSIQRNRTLVTIVQVGARLLEVGELERRVEALEAALQSRPDETLPFDEQFEDEEHREYVFEEDEG